MHLEFYTSELQTCLPNSKKTINEIYVLSSTPDVFGNTRPLSDKVAMASDAQSSGSKKKSGNISTRSFGSVSAAAMKHTKHAANFSPSAQIDTNSSRCVTLQMGNPSNASGCKLQHMQYRCTRCTSVKVRHVHKEQVR